MGWPVLPERHKAEQIRGALPEMLDCWHVLGCCHLLVPSPSQARDEKEAWLACLPKEVYRELSRREIDRVQELLKNTPDKRSLQRAEVGAVLVAALTMSVKGESASEDVQGTRQASLALARAFKSQEPLGATRELAAQLARPRPAGTSKTDTLDWRGLLDAPTLMIQFLPEGEGGDGIHSALQTNDRLKAGKNGILEKIRYLSANELTRTAVESEAKELELFGYRNAVIGSLTYYLVPAKMKPNKTAEEWRDLAMQMRDQSLALAEGAQKRDAPAVLKASGKLRSACSRCHNAF
jgi:hypothetical protein